MQNPKKADLLTFLRKTNQFTIPIYQRTYGWTEQLCKGLFEDIIRCGQSNKIKKYFVGAVVYTPKPDSVNTWTECYVIDGQQRLTTIILFLQALAEHLKDENIDNGNISYKKLRETYIVNATTNEEETDEGEMDEEDGRYLRMVLSKTDNENLRCILNEQTDLPESNLSKNYKNFKEWIKSSDIMEIWSGIKKLEIIEVVLESDDNPHLVFEAMNAKKLELSSVDLIRNFLLMGLSKKAQKKIYKSHWLKIEEMFKKIKKGRKDFFEDFIRDYLTLKTKVLPNQNRDSIYSAFKNYTLPKYFANEENDEAVEKLVIDIEKFAKYYCCIMFPESEEKDKKLKRFLQNIKGLNITVINPLLLMLYDDYANTKILSSDKFIQIIAIIEAYIFRISVTKTRTSGFNRLFISIMRSLENYINKEYDYLEAASATFLLIPGQQQFPSDAEFKSIFKTRSMYDGFAHSRYCLTKLEIYGTEKEKLNQDDCITIEHIMPRENDKWEEELKKEHGDNWENIHATYLHNIGNLTFTGYNPELGKRTFIEKRDLILKNGDEEKKVGLRYSRLQLNSGMANINAWTVEEIKKRADKFADNALKIWKTPILNKEILEKYKKEMEKSNLKYYKHIQDGEAMHSCFAGLQQEIMKLSSDISEDYWKKYISYKVKEDGKNFVDITPTEKKLRVFIHIDYSSIENPKNIVRDVSKIGRPSGANVEVEFKDIADLTYVMELIKKAFEVRNQ